MPRLLMRKRKKLPARFTCHCKQPMNKKNNPKSRTKAVKESDQNERFEDDSIQNSQTYVFQYVDEKTGFFIPCFNLFDISSQRLDKAKQDPDFYEYLLFQIHGSEQPMKVLHQMPYQHAMLRYYFNEVFQEHTFFVDYKAEPKRTRIILPKSTYDRINLVINDFGLSQINDLLFEVIATAQMKYIDMVTFWDIPKNQKDLNTIKKEIKKAIEIIEKLEEKQRMMDLGSSQIPSELLYINFVFNNSTIKIENTQLAREFILHFKDYYNNLIYKNWRLDLERSISRFYHDDFIKHHFKYNLAWSLYNLFVEERFFRVTKSQPFPNKLMLCIARLIEFCLIPVGNFEETDAVKIKHIRNWLKRNELEPALSFVKIPVNKKRLLKYFDPDFLDLTGDEKKADAINLAYYLGKRFKLEHLVPDFAHLAQTVKLCKQIMGYQLIDSDLLYRPQFEEFVALHKFVNGIRGKKKISSLRFSFENEEQEYELSHRLPLYLIEESLRKYSDDHRVDFDTDLVKATLENTAKGRLTITRSNRFNEPEERFMVRFVASFYNYLLAEAPPQNKRDLNPTERYYTIIAILLQNTRFFYRLLNPEPFIIEKVKQWHELALSK